VRSRGLEPPRVAPLAPQASASTNSATTANGLAPAARSGVEAARFNKSVPQGQVGHSTWSQGSPRSLMRHCECDHGLVTRRSMRNGAGRIPGRDGRPGMLTASRPIPARAWRHPGTAEHGLRWLVLGFAIHRSRRAVNAPISAPPPGLSAES
jgi:hypothetical protein